MSNMDIAHSKMTELDLEFDAQTSEHDSCQ